jgi:hypothetical protein
MPRHACSQPESAGDVLSSSLGKQGADKHHSGVRGSTFITHLAAVVHHKVKAPGRKVVQQHRGIRQRARQLVRRPDAGAQQRPLQPPQDDLRISQ